MSEIRWGILGPGGIARMFTRDLQLVGHRVTAVGSRSRDRAAAFADEFDIPNVHGSYEDLLADPDVDVVYIASPHSHHAEHALAAIAAGKHLLVEKAFTLDAQQARTVLDAAGAKGLTVVEAMWTRFLPHMDFVRDAIGRGQIGEVRSLHAEHSQALSSDPSHRLNAPELGGGALLDLGVYPLAFAHDILGSPTEITATGTLGPTGVDHTVATVLRHQNDAISTSFTTRETRGRNGASILGTEGHIEIAPVWQVPAPAIVFGADGIEVDRLDQSVPGRGMQFQADEVERLILDGQTESPRMTWADTIAVMETMDAIRATLGVRYPHER